MTDKSTLEKEKTWSVVASSEGHPEHDPHTTYVHVAGRLARADAVDWVDRIEHEADAALDDCGCDDVSEIDGEVRHTCSGYPIVSAFVCLDAEVDRYVTDGRAA